MVDVFNGLGASHPEGNFRVLSTERVQTTRLDDVPELHELLLHTRPSCPDHSGEPGEQAALRR